MSTVTTTKRNKVRKRAKARCEYCRTSERITGYALEIDHIIPESQEGSSEGGVSILLGVMMAQYCLVKRPLDGQLSLYCKSIIR